MADRLNAQMQNQIAELQKVDRSHRCEVIADLQRLRAAGELMAEGAEV